ncbi:hypothetical protein ABW19_dt0205625 [Dactylella cylindrospora]|nr:hypothetical protein ABW19_dt0205625 [Dactylella cylindrospora]
MKIRRPVMLVCVVASKYHFRHQCELRLNSTRSAPVHSFNSNVEFEIPKEVHNRARRKIEILQGRKFKKAGLALGARSAIRNMRQISKSELSYPHPTRRVRERVRSHPSLLQH